MVVTVGGQRYAVEQTNGSAGTTVERIVGRGLIGSERDWLEGRHARTLGWWAAVNPTGQVATARKEGFTSRRAALLWLLSEVTDG